MHVATLACKLSKAVHVCPPRSKPYSGDDSHKLLIRGEMAEWLKAHAWKACIPQGIQGSNPCLSAILESMGNGRTLENASITY
jgi:hypothetical protein